RILRPGQGGSARGRGARGRAALSRARRRRCAGDRGGRGRLRSTGTCPRGGRPGRPGHGGTWRRRHAHRIGDVVAVLTRWPPVQFTDVLELRGPLVIVRGATGACYDDVATISLPSGERRHGTVLEVDRDLAVVQVLEGTAGMAQEGCGFAFAG